MIAWLFVADNHTIKQSYFSILKKVWDSQISAIPNYFIFLLTTSPPHPSSSVDQSLSTVFPFSSSIILASIKYVHCVFLSSSHFLNFSQKKNHCVQNRFSAVLFSECGMHPSICLKLNEETILKRQRTPTVYTIPVSSASMLRRLRRRRISSPTVYCLNCGCQRNKQVLLGNDCCLTHTVGTSQKKRKQLFHIHLIPWRTPPSKRYRPPLRPPLAKKNIHKVFYTYATALFVHLEIKFQTNSATFHYVVANSRSSVSTR